MRVTSKSDSSTVVSTESGASIFEMIGQSQAAGGAARHSVVHVTVPVGSHVAAHFHNVCEETYYILAGAGRMVVNGRALELKPGQACLVEPGEVHEMFNEGEAPLECLVISSPAWIPDDAFLRD